MTTLWIRSRYDVPHREKPRTPKVAMCNVWLAGAKKITELQALVWLEDARCPQCFPTWTSHNTHMHGRRAAA